MRNTEARSSGRVPAHRKVMLTGLASHFKKSFLSPFILGEAPVPPPPHPRPVCRAFRAALIRNHEARRPGESRGGRLLSTRRCSSRRRLAKVQEAAPGACPSPAAKAGAPERGPSPGRKRLRESGALLFNRAYPSGRGSLSGSHSGEKVALPQRRSRPGASLTSLVTRGRLPLFPPPANIHYP